MKTVNMFKKICNLLLDPITLHISMCRASQKSIRMLFFFIGICMVEFDTILAILFFFLKINMPFRLWGISFLGIGFLGLTATIHAFDDSEEAFLLRFLFFFSAGIFQVYTILSIFAGIKLLCSSDSSVFLDPNKINECRAFFPFFSLLIIAIVYCVCSSFDKICRCPKCNKLTWRRIAKIKSRESLQSIGISGGGFMLYSESFYNCMYCKQKIITETFPIGPWQP